MALTKTTFSMVEGAVANVLDFGADPTGTADSTLAVQAAVDSGAGAVYFPAGTYLLTSKISLRSNLRLYGDGDASVINQSTSWISGFAAFYADSGSNVSANNLTRIFIEKLKFQNLTGTFEEFIALVAFGGVSNSAIKDCTFIGSRGDGVYIGNFGGSNPRQNFNITVSGCVFNGVNKENRNAVSVVSCEQCLIEGNRFTNYSRSNMPGPIDLEPDSAVDIVRNIKIVNNVFEANGGSSCIKYNGNAAPLNVKMSDILISGNTFLENTSDFVIQMSSAEDATTIAPQMIAIENNSISVTGNYNVINFAYGIRGVLFSENRILNGKASYIGDEDTAAVTVADFTMTNNYWNGSGDGGGFFRVGSVDSLKIDGNVFENPDGGTATRAMVFRGDAATTASTNVSVTNNTFFKGASQTTIASVINHTFSASTCNYGLNQIAGGTLAVGFFPEQGIATGTWVPEITFETPGDLAVTYNGQVQEGVWTKSGQLVTLHFMVQTTAFTHTTASGDFLIGPLPFTSYTTTDTGAPINVGSAIIVFGGSNQSTAKINIGRNTNYMNVSLESAGTFAFANEANVTSGNTVNIRGTISFVAA
jgi:hypothetical protein